MHRRYLAIAAVLFGFSQVGCFAEENQSIKWKKVYDDFIANPLSQDALQSFATSLPKIKNPLNPGDERYLVEGDVPLTLNGLKAYGLKIASDQKSTTANGDKNGELIYQLDDGGKPARWGSGDRVIAYAVVKSSFPDDQSYRRVIADMLKAGEDWEAVCKDCGLDFKYEPNFDKISTLDEFEAATSAKALKFVVAYTDSNGQFIASAFFPNDTWEKRILLVDKSYFDPNSSYPGRGVLRHELGHVLGYRHEHTRGVNGCFFEDNNWKPLTPYDAKSVMHYFCGGGGTLSLELTEFDRTGHIKFYSPEN